MWTFQHAVTCLQHDDGEVAQIACIAHSMAKKVL